MNKNLFDKAIKPKLPKCFISNVVYHVKCLIAMIALVVKLNTVVEHIAQHKSCFKARVFVLS